jgi:hypothetical protein
MWSPNNGGCGSSTGSIKGRNPFAQLPFYVLVELYTPNLQAADSSLQWAMQLSGSTTHWETPTDRGNQAVAKAMSSTALPWLSKPQYICFSEMRAFPRLQLAKLHTAIKDHGLPFAQPAVQLLVRQLLYHVGTVPWSIRLVVGTHLVTISFTVASKSAFLYLTLQ